ncbi:DUF397 domain-containing protein [Actinomadura sp. 1N219]|uniref:DUF397 domain-containing protein n=1 Tax=Actinomadura sp. 1N219 TaxID=3375152 RepID=UPI0037B9830B
MSEAIWRKSSRSDSGTEGDCVELADLDGRIGVRDSQNPHHPHITIGREALQRLVGRIKAGDLDL